VWVGVGDGLAEEGATPPILISITPPTGLSRGVMEINIAEL